jgi:membrane protease YdiL (CAAX protease family)
MPWVDSLLDGRTGLDTLLLFFAVVLMPAISAFTGWQLAHKSAERRNLVSRYWQTLIRGWLVAVVILAVWYRTGRPLGTLGLHWPIGPRGLWGFGFDLLLVVASTMQLMRLPQIARKTPDKAKAVLERLKITPRTGAELAMFLVVAVTAGVWEELLYRGFLMWFLAPDGPATAVIGSSLIFGLGHAYQGGRGVLVTAGVGLVFALAYALSASLWWLMVAHALIDIHGGIAAYRLHRSPAPIQPIVLAMSLAKIR